MDETRRRNGAHRLRRWFWWLPLLVLAAAWSWGFYRLGIYAVYRTHPEFSQQEQASTILANVARLIEIPQDETPSVAAIADAAQAKLDQPFLAGAENGDVLIVYQQPGEALLYRPSTNKLIAVGPVTNASQGVSAPPLPAATSTNATTTLSRK